MGWKIVKDARIVRWKPNISAVLRRKCILSGSRVFGRIKLEFDMEEKRSHLQIFGTLIKLFRYDVPAGEVAIGIMERQVCRDEIWRARSRG